MAGDVTGRRRKVTYKGAEYFGSIYLRKRQKLNLDIMATISNIEESMRSFINVTKVRELLSRLDSLMKEFIEVSEQYRRTLTPEETALDDQVVDRAEGEVYLLKTRSIKWLRDAEQKLERDVSPSRASTRSRSESQLSRRSRSSRATSSQFSRRSTQEKMADEAVKFAELRVAENFAESKHLLARTQLQEKIAKSEAKMAAYKTFTSNQHGDVSNYDKFKEETCRYKNATFGSKDLNNHHHAGDENYQDSNPSLSRAVGDVFNSLGRSNVSANQPDVTNFQQDDDDELHSTFSRKHESTRDQDLAAALRDLLLQQGAPDGDLDIFDGNVLKFKYFITTFEEMVEKRIKDPRGRLTRLIKYTRGEAKELIKGCIQKPPTSGYILAKQLLEKRFGDPHRILAAYRKELRSMSQLKPGDATGFRTLYTFLLKCNSLVEGQYWNTLDAPDNLCAIVSKLPNSSRDRWNSKTLMLRMRHGREPTLSDLLEFVDQECTLANDPLFSRDALEEHSNQRQRNGKESGKTRPVKTFSSNISKCPACDKNHDLEKCKDYMERSIRDKCRWLMRKRLCFGCYGAGHIVRACKNKRTCTTCKEKHPTGLHEYHQSKMETKNDEREETSPEQGSNIKNCSIASSTSSERSISMCVVPVILRHKDAMADILTFALLDNCSQGTFIHEELLSCLGLKGTESEITVKTLTGEQTEKSSLLNGLLVKGANKDTNDWIKLPKTYSKGSIPVSNEEIPTPTKIRQWTYLNDVADQLCEERDVRIGLLIGANCPRALEPEKVIPSQNGGPYAFRSQLGWCVVGPMAEVSNESARLCNRISVTSLNKEPTAHQFCVMHQWEDRSIDDMLQRTYTSHKIADTSMDDDLEVSQEDLQFMELMRHKVKLKNGHYEVPLPFDDNKLI